MLFWILMLSRDKSHTFEYFLCHFPKERLEFFMEESKIQKMFLSSDVHV